MHILPGAPGFRAGEYVRLVLVCFARIIQVCLVRQVLTGSAGILPASKFYTLALQ